MKKIFATLAFLLLVTLSLGQGIKGIQPVYYKNTQATMQPDVSYKAPYQQIQRNNEIEAQIRYQNQVNANTKALVEKEKAVALMKQVKSYYNSFEVYPKSIPDGWYKVYAMDNYDFCEERTVYVSDSRVTKYFIDSKTQRWVSHSHAINNAKTTIQLRYNDGTTGSILEIYFIGYLNDY